MSDIQVRNNALARLMSFKGVSVSDAAIYLDSVSPTYTFDTDSFFHRALVTTALMLNLPYQSSAPTSTSLYFMYFHGLPDSILTFQPDVNNAINQLGSGNPFIVNSGGNIICMVIFSNKLNWFIQPISFSGNGLPTSVSAGTDISVTGTPPNYVVNNTAPDQVVSLTAGTGISTSGPYPNFTITNTAPDQTVSLTAGTGISTSGPYPNFTVTNTAPDQTVSLTAGAGISISGAYPNFTITSTMTSKYLLASTTTPASYAYGANNVVFTAANTFSSTSGDWTNTGGGYITYTGTPALFEAVIRVRCTGSTGLFDPAPTLYINGRWTNQVMTGFTATSGSIDVEYCFGIQINSGVQSTHSMSTIPLFTGDVIGIFFRSNNGLSGTASNFQYTFKIISK